jgi:predicted HTH domain antitoxin
VSGTAGRILLWDFDGTLALRPGNWTGTLRLRLGRIDGMDDLPLLWVIDRVRSGHISLGRGAELAGMDRWSFMQAMSEHGVPVIGHSVEDLRKDIATLDSL